MTAANEQIGGVKGVLDTTFAALSMVSDTLKQIRTTLTRLADGAIAADQRATYGEQYKLLAQQVSEFINDAKYNGRTLLSTATASGAKPSKCAITANLCGTVTFTPRKPLTGRARTNVPSCSGRTGKRL